MKWNRLLLAVLNCMFALNEILLISSFVDTESLVLELYRIVHLVKVFLLAKEFSKMCRASWYIILVHELNVCFSCLP